MPSFEVLLLRLLMVVVIGGLIGAEREYVSKSAGFRTMILICLGSFLFSTFSVAITGATNDRIASNIVTGIGFLGGGVIFRSGNRINGITTASSIWATAALGMGIANGYYTIVLLSTFIILVSLILFTKMEKWIDKINQSKNYKIVSTYSLDLLSKYEAIINKNHLKYKLLHRTKVGNNIVATWIVEGREKDHQNFIEAILHDETVHEFQF